MDLPGKQSEIQISSAVRQKGIVEAIKQDWSHTLSTVPDVIHILGESTILASAPSAALVEFSFDGNSSATLPASLFKCNQRGRRAYIDAHTGMTKISMYAEQASPVINKIIQLIGKPNTEMNKKRIDIQLKLLEEVATTCTVTAEFIKTRFKDWSTLTDQLLLAVSDRKDKASRDNENQKKEIKQQEQHMNTAMFKAQVADTNLEKQKLAVHAARQNKKQADMFARMTLQAGMVTSAAAPIVVPFAAAAFLTLSAASVVVSSTSSLSQAETVAKMQEIAIQEEEEKRQVLVAKMERLQNAEASLHDIAAVLFEALDELKLIQQKVDNVLSYFAFIRNNVEKLMSHHYHPFIETLRLEGAIGSGEEAVEVQEEDLQPMAKTVKEHFIIMQRISQVYSEVSEEYIIPGFNAVDKISSSRAMLSPEEVSEKHTQLESYRKEAVDNIRKKAALRQRQLIDNIKSIKEQSSEGTTQKVVKDE